MIIPLSSPPAKKILQTLLVTGSHFVASLRPNIVSNTNKSVINKSGSIFVVLLLVKVSLLPFSQVETRSKKNGKWCSFFLFSISLQGSGCKSQDYSFTAFTFSPALFQQSPFSYSIHIMKSHDFHVVFKMKMTRFRCHWLFEIEYPKSGGPGSICYDLMNFSNLGASVELGRYIWLNKANR